MTSQRTVKIEVPVLARVEGEGALELEIRDKQITQLKLRIFEPPRYFEKFIESHNCDDVIDMVARICGICPVAYQMTAVQAFENLFEIEPSPWVKAMRKAMYCGEWIQSHALHIHLLAAPDFMGFNSAIDMAEDHADIVRRGLRLQTLGNDLIALFGARSVHPVGIKVGGFYKAPAPEAVTEVVNRLNSARDDAESVIEWLADLPLPDNHQDFISVALQNESDYAIYRGNIVSDNGLNTPIETWQEHFEEKQLAHSTALYAYLHGKPYLVGPLARLNLNQTHLPTATANCLAKTGIQFPSSNMFHSIIARAVEMHMVINQALDILENYHVPEHACTEHWAPKAGVTYGASEAPRGVLWHRYEVDETGLVSAAQIVPPTSQNQARIEQDIAQSLMAYGLDHDNEQLRLRAETVIRNYDPCISCATHFLKLKVSRH